jgi:hypothetical protein
MPVDDTQTPPPPELQAFLWVVRRALLCIKPHVTHPAYREALGMVVGYIERRYGKG